MTDDGEIVIDVEEVVPFGDAGTDPHGRQALLDTIERQNAELRRLHVENDELRRDVTVLTHALREANEALRNLRLLLRRADEFVGYARKQVDRVLT